MLSRVPEPGENLEHLRAEAKTALIKEVTTQIHAIDNKDTRIAAGWKDTLIRIVHAVDENDFASLKDMADQTESNLLGLPCTFALWNYAKFLNAEDSNPIAQIRDALPAEGSNTPQLERLDNEIRIALALNDLDRLASIASQLREPLTDLKLAIWKYLLPKRREILEQAVNRILQNPEPEEHRWLTIIKEIKQALALDNLKFLTATANQSSTTSYNSFPLKSEIWHYVRAANQAKES